MAATLTHSHPAVEPRRAPRDLAVRKSPKSWPSWASKLIAFLSLPSEVFIDARDEARKAHERLPFVEWYVRASSYCMTGKAVLARARPPDTSGVAPLSRRLQARAILLETKTSGRRRHGHLLKRHPSQRQVSRAPTTEFLAATSSRPSPIVFKPGCKPKSICTNAPTEREELYVPFTETVSSRPLWISPDQNCRWCDVLMAKAAGLVNRHYHPHEVFAYTISGKWGYLEHDWIATAGDFIYESPGEAHTLVAYDHPDADDSVLRREGPADLAR